MGRHLETRRCRQLRGSTSQWEEGVYTIRPDPHSSSTPCLNLIKLLPFSRPLFPRMNPARSVIVTPTVVGQFPGKQTPRWGFVGRACTVDSLVATCVGQWRKQARTEAGADLPCSHKKGLSNGTRGSGDKMVLQLHPPCVNQGRKHDLVWRSSPQLRAIPEENTAPSTAESRGDECLRSTEGVRTGRHHPLHLPRRVLWRVYEMLC